MNQNVQKSTKFGRRSAVHLAVGVALAIPCFILATRGVDWHATFATIATARPTWLVLAGLLFTISSVIRGVRWSTLLASEKPVGVATAFWGTMVGNLGNNFLPLRAGEVLRSAMMGRATGISRTFVLASALMERVLDALVLMVLLPLFLSKVSGLAEFSDRVVLLALTSVVGLAAMPFALKLVPHIERLIVRIPFISVSIRDMASHMLGKFTSGLGSLFHTRRAVIASTLTVGAWAVDASAGVVVAVALDLQLDFMEAFTLLAALGLSSALPSTPGFLGIFQFVAVTVLSPFGFTKDQALAYILVFQGVCFCVYLLWGLIGFSRMKQVAIERAVHQAMPAAEPAFHDR